MTRRPSAIALLVVLAAFFAALAPGQPAPARAAEYSLESVATYDVMPADGLVQVGVDLTLTNTTPDPAGQFSVFDELVVAIHDHAEAVTASDEEGELDVVLAGDDGVNAATIGLREGLRFEETVEVRLEYRLDDGNDPAVRIGPSLTVFPAWGFGTASEVTVEIPPGFEVRIDGDPLTDDGGSLTSGPIDDPGAWLSLVTAVGPLEYESFETTVALQGGTADLVVRAFSDDPDWGTATLDLLVEALPLIEREVGLPYPLLGQLVLTQGVPSDGSGFGESVSRRDEIVVAYDQPPFTVLHQVAHVWMPSTLVDARWIREGLASDVAARVGEELELDPPYDPAEVADERAESAMVLDAWTTSTGPEANAYAYAASWALIAELRREVGADALRTVLARTADSIGPYDGAAVGPTPANGSAPAVPLTGRSFLDQLETVAQADLSDRFAAIVLAEPDGALLPDRAGARATFDALLDAASGWGAPDPVRASMGGWQFVEADAQMRDAEAWLQDRDDLLAAMERAGLSNPDRLQQAYRAYGGGPEAVSELEAQQGVVDAYAAAAERITAPRSFMARLGLLGSSDPAAHLSLANGWFADGDLRGAIDAITEADRVLASAETSGIVRLASLALLVILTVAVTVAVFRRRASYTSAP